MLIDFAFRFHTEPYAGSWTWFEAAIVRGLGGDDFVGDPDSIARSRIQGSSVLPPTRDTHHRGSTPEPYQVPNTSNGSRVWMLQRNLRAHGAEALHEIVWTDVDDEDTKEDTNEALDRFGRGSGYGFVRSLEPGDRIAVYARAQVNIAFHESLAIDASDQIPFRSIPSTLDGLITYKKSRYRYSTLRSKSPSPMQIINRTHSLLPSAGGVKKSIVHNLGEVVCSCFSRRCSHFGCYSVFALLRVSQACRSRPCGTWIQGEWSVPRYLVASRIRAPRLTWDEPFIRTVHHPKSLVALARRSATGLRER